MSPAVIEDGGRFQMLYRRVLARSGDASRQSEYEDRSVIALAESGDGLRFTARPAPVLIGEGQAAGFAGLGVEDPTIVRHDDEYLVFYTGWSGWATGIATLLWAHGPLLDRLTPQGVAIAPTPPFRFVKEAEVRHRLMWCEVDTVDTHERSRIAVSHAVSPTGPWSAPVIVAAPRPDCWDAINISPGPLIEEAGRLFMLYNGMVRTDDPDFVHAARVGLMELDPSTGLVIGRSNAPLLEPPPGNRILVTEPHLASSTSEHRTFFSPSAAISPFRSSHIK